MFRVIFSFAGAAVFSVLFLFALKQTIEVNNSALKTDDNLRYIDFVRVKRAETITKKERNKPQKPKPKKPLPKPRVNISKPQKAAPMQHAPLQAMPLDLPSNLTASSALGDALVGGYTAERAVNANVIPLARIDPIYPRRARRMKKEGFVKMEFTITETGTVQDIEVVASNPPQLFDQAAIRALSKWKFKAKMEGNKAVSQRAEVQIDFKLKR